MGPAARSGPHRQTSRSIDGRSIRPHRCDVNNSRKDSENNDPGFVRREPLADDESPITAAARLHEITESFGLWPALSGLVSSGKYDAAAWAPLPIESRPCG